MNPRTLTKLLLILLIVATVVTVFSIGPYDWDVRCFIARCYLDPRP